MTQFYTNSSLCKNLCELENDFKYNLYLLKVRDAEIKRLSARLGSFADERASWLQQKLALTSKVKHLEVNLSETRGNLHQVISGSASRQLALESALKVAEAAAAETEQKNRARTLELLKSGKDEVELLRAEWEERCRGEAAKSEAELKKHKTKIKQQAEENIALHANWTQEKLQLVSKASVLESEVHKLELDNKNIKNDLDNLSGQLQESTQQFMDVSQEIITLQNKIHSYSIEIKKLQEENNIISSENAQIAANFKTLTEERTELQKMLENTRAEIGGMEETVIKYRQNQEDAEKIVKQNQILQEVIKSLKNKEKCTQNN